MHSQASFQQAWPGLCALAIVPGLPSLHAAESEVAHAGFHVPKGSWDGQVSLQPDATQLQPAYCTAVIL